MRKALFFLALLVVFAVCGSATVRSEDKKASGEEIAAEIIELRETLAKNFIKPGAEVTEETFKGVCGAVAKRAREISTTQGVVIRHAAKKHRNPKNAPNEDEQKLIEKFTGAGLKDFKDSVTVDAKSYSRYVRPIYVQEACLSCHGQKENRPAFIVEKYPDDRAFGFKAGDLRGIIIVLTPERP